METKNVTPSNMKKQLVAELNNLLSEKMLEVDSEGMSLVRVGSLYMHKEAFECMLAEFAYMDGTKPFIEAHMANMMSDVLKNLQRLSPNGFEMRQAA